MTKQPTGTGSAAKKLGQPEGPGELQKERKSLRDGAHPPKDLVQFFRDSPLVGIELDLERENDGIRDIEL